LKKKEIDDNKEINYENHINDVFDIIFKENTFNHLIDSGEDNINYLDDLKSYIEQICISYNNEQAGAMKALSVMELEDHYNTVFGSEDDKYIRNLFWWL